MAIWKLFNEYISLTAPIINLSILFLMAQMIFQAIPPTLVIIMSIQRRSGVERCVLSVVPIVFIFTYAIIDPLLGGSFLGGGFHHVPELMRFLHHPQLLLEVGVLLVLFPILIFFVNRWMKQVKWWVMVLGALASWSMYLVCLLGFTAMFFDSGLILRLTGEKLILWYTYSIYAVLFQTLLNLTAVLMHVLFREKEKEIKSWEALYDDGWCKKRIVHLLLRGHRVCLCVFLPLFLLLAALLLPEMKAGELGIVTILLFLPFIGVILLTSLRILIPTMVRAVRHVYAWEDGERRRRTFCKEFFDPSNPPYHGDGMDLTEHFLLMRSTLNPVLLYLPDVRSVQLNKQQYTYTATLNNGERVLLGPLNQKDHQLLRSCLKESVPDRY